MTRRKGTKPEQFAGPFQSYAEVPARYRLETFSAQYRGEDTWYQYCDDVLFEEHDSEHIRETARKAGDSWSNFMTDHSRHHALATPQDANEWCEELLESRVQRTCYEQYFVRIYHFYEWLKSTYQHPHLYNPLLLAAINYDAARHVWMYRVETRPEVVSRE